MNSATAFAPGKEKSYVTPFQVEVVDCPETRGHSIMKHFAGYNITVKEVMDTKRGKAFKFRSSFGTHQILEKFTRRDA